MHKNSTLTAVFRPYQKVQAGFYDVALLLAGSFFIALCAQVTVWLPFSPVPVTGQTFAVLVTGAALGSRRGSLCVLTYLAEGLAGLPGFASARAGLPILFGPTGGYLFGFVAAAYITGLLAENGWDRQIWSTMLAMTFGLIAIYTFGLVWLFGFLGNNNLFVLGLYPFIAGEVVKIFLAAVILPSVWKLIGNLS